MKKLEQRLAGARATWRRALSYAPLVDPAARRPARIALRLTDADLPGSLGEGGALTMPQWRHLLVSAVEWLGPSSVTILAVGPAPMTLLAELVRFTHRLECRVGLVTDGTGIDRAAAELLVDRGLAWAQVVVGGVSDAVQQSVVGNHAREATTALRELGAARRDRRVGLDIEVAVPWRSLANTEVRAVLGWAREAGADGFRVQAPYRSSDLPADPEALDGVMGELRPFNRTRQSTVAALHTMIAHADGEPGMARQLAPRAVRRTRCPVGGQRVEITANGQVVACPFKAPIGRIDTSLPEIWAQAAPHLEAIRTCGRACLHDELAHRSVLGG